MAASRWRERSEAEPAPRCWNSLLGGEEPPSLSSFPSLSFFFFYYIISASGFQLQLVFSPQECCVCREDLILVLFQCSGRLRLSHVDFECIYLFSDCNPMGEKNIPPRLQFQMLMLAVSKPNESMIYLFLFLACLRPKDQWSDLHGSWGRKQLLFAEGSRGEIKI